MHSIEIERIPDLAALSDQATEIFRREGVLIVDRLLEPGETLALRERFAPLFRGEFETGIYPDEWYWREGISLPDATRHMANAWKSDSVIARLALSSRIGQAAARLGEWSGARLGQDTLWWKVPGARAGALHQDSSFVDFLDPAVMLTCWVALDETQKGAGTIEYVPGSHHWALATRPVDFHAPEGGYRAKMLRAAAAAGVSDPICVELEVSAGAAVFHHGAVWHGSGVNQSVERVRRSIGVHLLPAHARFATETGGYIYGRYKRPGDNSLDEAFFPITWSRTGYRSPCADLLASNSEVS